MIPIPLDEEVIRSHCGRIVCAVTHDGRQFIGRLSLCRDGKIILNEEEVPEEVVPIFEEECEPKKKPHKRQVKRVKRPCKPVKPVKRPCKPCSGKKSKVTSLQPYGAPASYPGPHQGLDSRGRIELDLTLIALLFLLLV